jgi:glycosyltransferase involved in cell wall biosynthesis
MNSKLAIVIPAYKRTFFKKTLESIANQTCKDFILYIGDDKSPNNLEEIVEPFCSVINIKYEQFDSNLGGVSLTKQWERCISLSVYEPFIWLFSDDDVMPTDAVERFYGALENGVKFDVYRFNLSFIDKNDLEIRGASEHPGFENSIDFIRRRLRFETISAACEYIFSRKKYIENGGFVEFPLAWCSDDATWAIFARERGICTISGEPIKMRMVPGLNISSVQSLNYLKFRAVIRYCFWLRNHFQGIPEVLIKRYLISQINSLPFSFVKKLREFIKIVRLTRPLFAISLLIHRSRFYKLVLRSKK